MSHFEVAGTPDGRPTPRGSVVQTPPGSVLLPVSAVIRGTGSCLPDKVLSNADLAKIVDTSDEWITERTGMKERRVVVPGQAASDLASEAARRALESAGLAATDIGMVIVATITGDKPLPATACVVQAKIGASNAAAFDLAAGCSGFAYGLTVAEQFLRTSMIKHALVIGVEVLSPFMDWTDRGTCVLFGDGSGAVVLSAELASEEDAAEANGNGAGPRLRGLLSSHIGADGTGADFLHIPAGGSATPASATTVEEGGHYVKMDGRAVFKVAVRRMVETVQRLCDDAGVEPGDIDMLIPHQANRRIIDAVTRQFGLPPEKVFINIQKYGNTSSASTVICLDEAVRQGVVKQGDLIATVAFGAGLTWGGNLIRL